MTSNQTNDKKKVKMPSTPELDKAAKLKAQSQPLGEFLEWYRSHLDELEGLDIEEALAKYFNIDLKKCEAERRALLAAIQEGQ